MTEWGPYCVVAALHSAAVLQASKKASEAEKSLMSAYNQAKAKLKETYSKSEL